MVIQPLKGKDGVLFSMVAACKCKLYSIGLSSDKLVYHWFFFGLSFNEDSIKDAWKGSPIVGQGLPRVASILLIQWVIDGVDNDGDNDGDDGGDNDTDTHGDNDSDGDDVNDDGPPQGSQHPAHSMSRWWCS